MNQVDFMCWSCIFIVVVIILDFGVSSYFIFSFLFETNVGFIICKFGTRYVNQWFEEINTTVINNKFNFFHFFPKLSIFKLRFLESNNLNCWFWLDHAEILYFKRNAIESWNRSLILLFHLNCLTRNDWMK